tara:strand:+ start:3343 stop:3816 length:474 start_codon:yes stop_codon:yes gene_type:complete
MKSNIFYFILFVCSIAASRIIPHPPNFTPILAIAVMAPLLTGNVMLGIVLSLSSMILSDLYWGYHNTIGWVYFSIALSSLLTRYINNAYLAGIGASILFFVVTNFAVWLSGYYGFTMEGLLACYIAAIPFFQNTIAGTLIYIMIIKSIVSVQRRIYA